jgi:hypothetical protein
MKVNFFCIGAQKAGTSTLHDLLGQHPEIYLPEEKEAHFFDVNEEYEKGINHYFNKYFFKYNNEKIIGNINPNLQIETRSIDRIIKHFGQETKFIFIVRNPVNRAYSHYLMSKKRGYEDLSFLEALAKEKYRINNPTYFKDYESQEPAHFEKNHFGYLSRSRYSHILKYLYKNVPKENIKVLIFEEFISDLSTHTNSILDFLGIKRIPLDIEIKSNKAEKAISEDFSRFLNTESSLKDKLKIFLPQKIRYWLKHKTMKMNYVPVPSHKSKPNNYEYSKAKGYFEKDIVETEMLIEKKTGYI